MLKESIDQLYFSVAVRDMGLFRSSLPSNISYNSLLYLDVIFYRGASTVTELARQLHVSKGAVSMKVRELERQGLVERRQSREDGRVVHLCLSEEMERLYRRADRLMERAVQRAGGQFTPQELETACRLIELVAQWYEKGEEEDGREE